MIAATPAIFASFENLLDPRAEGGNKKQNLHEMFIIALCATIAGADSWTDVEHFGKEKLDWFREFLELEYGVPSHHTFGRVFAGLESNAFSVVLPAWIEQLQLDLGVVSVKLRTFDFPA